MEKDAFASLWCISGQCKLFLKQRLKKYNKTLFVFEKIYLRFEFETKIFTN